MFVEKINFQEPKNIGFHDGWGDFWILHSDYCNINKVKNNEYKDIDIKNQWKEE